MSEELKTDQTSVPLVGNSYEGAGQEVHGLQSILHAYADISSSLDLEQTLQKACQAATQLTSADHSGLVIFEEGLEKGKVWAEHPSIGMLGLELPLRGVKAEEELLNSKEPLIIPNVKEKASLGPVRDILLSFGIRSILIIPVIGKHGILGSFSLDSIQHLRTFTTDEINLCKAFAAQVAIAIENAHLYEEEKLWRRQLEALRLTMLDITTKQNRGKLLKTIIERAVGLLGGKSGGIYEYHPERQELTIIADFNRSDNIGKTLRVGQGMAGRLVMTGAEPFMIVHDYNNWPDRADIYEDQRPFGAVLEVPLQRGEEIIGVLYVDDAVGRLFTEKDAHLLGLFADQATIALVNAELTASDETKLKKIELLAHAASEFMVGLNTKSLEDRLKLVARHTTKILDAEVCGIFLVNEPGWLSLEAGHGYREGKFKKGLRLPILSEPKGGLTSHLAWEGKLFNAHGDELVNHPAVSGKPTDFIPSGTCTSLLAIPLKKAGSDDSDKAVCGLLSVSNKKSEEGESLPSLKFTEEDEWILRTLAKTIMIAIENAELVTELIDMESQLALLLEAGKTVAHADGLDEGLQNLSVMVVSLLSNTFCRILLLDESGSALVAKAAYPIERQGTSFHWHPRLQQRTAISQYPGLIEFLEAGQPNVIHWSDLEVQPHLKHFSEGLEMDKPVQSLLLVPLKFGEELIGLLDVGEIRSEERSPFTEDKIKLAAGIASQISALIKRIWHYERRKHLLLRLEAAVHNVMAQYDIRKLHQEIVNMAASLVEYSAAALFIKHPHTPSLEMCASSGIEASPDHIIPNEVELISNTAKTGTPQIIQDSVEPGERDEALARFGLRTMLTVPLKQHGEVVAVLLVADKAGRRTSVEAELEVLERFAGQSSIALQTAQLMSEEQLAVRNLDILHQITDYILVAQDIDKVLDAVLTSVTADYGLGFDRAAVFLLDELGGHLVGRRGIGSFRKEQGQSSREREHGPSDFKAYLVELENNDLSATPLSQRITGLHLPISSDSNDPFSKTVAGGGEVLIVQANTLNELPAEFREALDPTTDMVLVSMFSRGYPIGLLVADNKFSEMPITNADVAALMTFTNTAAMAVDNIRLFQRIEKGREKLRLLFKASTALSKSEEPRQVLAEIVEQTRIAANATSVIIVLSDDAGRSRTLISKSATGHRLGIEHDDDIGMQVMQSGECHWLDDLRRGSWRSSLDRYGNIRCQKLCLPLSLYGKKFGWMWILYDNHRIITEFEVDALNLYVNHAAVAYDSARRMEALTHMRYAAEALAGAATPQGVLSQIVLRACAALQADSAAIWMYDAVRNSFTPEGWVAHNISAELRDEFWKAKPSSGGTAYTVMKKGWISVEDTSDLNAAPFLGSTTRSLLDRIGVQSFLGICLTVGTEPLGVLYLNYCRPHTFNEEETQMVRTFANHAALALKKARLMEQLTKAKKAAEAVARVTVLEKRDVALESIVVETKKALDCSAVVLYEYDKNSQQLLHPPTTVGVRNKDAMLKQGIVDSGSIVYLILEKNQPYVVERVLDDPMFRSRRFAQEEEIKSCVGIPLKIMHEKVGVMFINYRTSHRFTPDEMDNMNLFANQAAVAIRNAQLFDSRNQQLRQQGELLKISTELLGIVSLQETIERAVGYAASVLSVDLCAIVLPDEEGEMILSAGYGWNQDLIGMKQESDRVTQTGLTMKTRRPVVVPDYRREARFEVPRFLLDHEAMSGASVPMFIIEAEEKVQVGVMLVHSKTPRRFSDEDLNLLQLIANEIAIAIQRTRQYDELKVTRWRIGARTALVWMGMVGNHYQHTIDGHANTINAILDVIKAEEKQKSPAEKLPDWVEEHLSNIRKNATKIVERPITPPLSSEEGITEVDINHFISERLNRLWQEERREEQYKNVRLKSGPNPMIKIIVRISREWFRRAFDILIDNAVKELRNVSHARRQLEVITSVQNKEVEILVKDQGRGFPQEVMDKIFKGKIEKREDTEGMGMGLLIAQAIIETYGGKLDIKETSRDGTTMGIWLPIIPHQEELIEGRANVFHVDERNDG